mmetsp:Transcript_8215/g.15244  ORF Transcript_8215/g.15244 Transcript_8215/m.15244 type:complete len:301 (+) Transcript_8215:1266-2168(+)
MIIIVSLLRLFCLFFHLFRLVLLERLLERSDGVVAEHGLLHHEPARVALVVEGLPPLLVRLLVGGELHLLLELLHVVVVLFVQLPPHVHVARLQVLVSQQSLPHLLLFAQNHGDTERVDRIARFLRVNFLEEFQREREGLLGVAGIHRNAGRCNLNRYVVLRVLIVRWGVDLMRKLDVNVNILRTLRPFERGAYAGLDGLEHREEGEQRSRDAQPLHQRKTRRAAAAASASSRHGSMTRGHLLFKPPSFFASRKAGLLRFASVRINALVSISSSSEFAWGAGGSRRLAAWRCRAGDGRCC